MNQAKGKPSWTIGCAVVSRVKPSLPQGQIETASRPLLKLALEQKEDSQNQPSSPSTPALENEINCTLMPQVTSEKKDLAPTRSFLTISIDKRTKLSNTQSSKIVPKQQESSSIQPYLSEPIVSRSELACPALNKAKNNQEKPSTVE